MAHVVPPDAFLEWQRARNARLVSPQGNLALIETRWGADDPEAAREGHPDTVTATRLRRTDPLTGDVERGVRLWDADSAAIRAFRQVKRFDYDPRWVLQAGYAEVPGARKVPFEHIKDNGGTRELAVPGDITLTLGGRDYTLLAFDDGGTLLLVFADTTTGDGTYAPGRFLSVPREPGATTVTLDFNRAYVPPCGFSAHFNCPMPPPQNRLALPVEAGERLPDFADGFTIH
jgi:uncharacterized protein (DUF1684 family)